MRRLLFASTLVIGATVVSPASAGTDFSLGADFPLLVATQPTTLLGIGYYGETTFGSGAVTHGVRLGGERWGGTKDREKVSVFALGYRMYFLPMERWSPFLGLSVGSYGGGATTDGTDPGLRKKTIGGGELGFEWMFSSTVRGIGLRLSMQALKHPDHWLFVVPVTLMWWNN